MLTLPERNSYIRTIVCFPLCRTNIITSWLQGAVGSKADIKSQTTLLQLNKSLFLIVLC
jgi:hypothetical protein